MVTSPSRRKLTVVLHGDVAGYSELMDRDEDLSHQRVTLYFDLLESTIERYSGAVLEKRGDALLAEFAQPSAAMGAALTFQGDIETRNERLGDDIRPSLRIGINLGEVILDRATVWGPGVNLAQRIEQLAEPGGVCVSDTVYNAVSKSLPIAYEDLGERQVKESTFRAFRARLEPGAKIAPPPSSTGGAGAAGSDTQDVRYCRTSDGVRLAWTALGTGPPLVRVLNWATSLEWEWQTAGPRHLIDLLATHATLIRYDARSVGLSERRRDFRFDLEQRYTDLVAAVDASGHDRVALMGVSEGGPTALAYAARHPERVSHLVLLGAANLVPVSGEYLESMAWMPVMLHHCWGASYIQARRVLAALFGLDEEADGPRKMVELCRASMRAEDAGKMMAQMIRSSVQIDVPALAERVQAPALVIHSRDDVLVPAKNAQYIASHLPNARLKLIDSKNHVMGFVSSYDELVSAEIQSFLGS